MERHRLSKLVSQSVKRVGRGIAGGQGKTAGRGTKGQKSRAGYNLPKKFEGGQTPLVMRLPKIRGRAPHRARIRLIVQRRDIARHYSAGETVSPATLLAKGLVHTTMAEIKIIGAGELPDIIIEDVAQSRSRKPKGE